MFVVEGIAPPCRPHRGVLVGWGCIVGAIRRGKDLMETVRRSFRALSPFGAAEQRGWGVWATRRRREFWSFGGHPSAALSPLREVVFNEGDFGGEVVEGVDVLVEFSFELGGAGAGGVAGAG